IVRIDDLEHPWFEDMRVKVALSSARPLTFVFRKPDGTEVEVPIEAYRGDNDKVPVIGVTPPPSLRLWPEKMKRITSMPVVYGSAAAHARATDLRPGDVVLRATDPDKGDELTALKHDRKAGTFDGAELCRRMVKLGDRPLVLEVSRAGAADGASPERLTVPA